MGNKKMHYKVDSTIHFEGMQLTYISKTTKGKTKFIVERVLIDFSIINKKIFQKTYFISTNKNIYSLEDVVN